MINHLTPSKPTPTLDELLDGVTDRNIHGEVDTDSAIGNKVW